MRHMNQLKKNNHHSYKLQKIWNDSKYPEQIFKLIILQQMNNNDEKQIRDLEEYYINLYNSVEDGYNVSRKANPFSDKLLFCGKNHPLYGTKVSDETKQKISSSVTETMKNPEIRKKISDYHKNKKLSLETKQKMSIKKKGIDNASSKLTEEQVINICKKLNSKVSMKNLSIEFNVHYNTIRGIKDKVSWKHITNKYLKI